jgi:hypothetical protein
LPQADPPLSLRPSRDEGKGIVDGVYVLNSYTRELRIRDISFGMKREGFTKDESAWSTPEIALAHCRKRGIRGGKKNQAWPLTATSASAQDVTYGGWGKQPIGISLSNSYVGGSIFRCSSIRPNVPKFDGNKIAHCAWIARFNRKCRPWRR